MRTATPPSEAVCRGKGGCGETKPASEFIEVRDKRSPAWRGLTSLCRDCLRKRTTEWREANRERYNANARAYLGEAVRRDARNEKRRRDPRLLAYARAYHLKRKYDLTPEDYADMHEAQGGVCAICGREETATVRGKVLELAVDHCHRTKANRGLLCFNCNVGIGKFDDDPERLLGAVAYLLRTR